LRGACLALLERWRADPARAASALHLARWREMLEGWSDERIAAVVLDDEGGQALRQCSPLGPALSPRERWRILEEVNRRLDADPRT
jgi:hypothetical protein